jgi:hypothetical protein
MRTSAFAFATISPSEIAPIVHLKMKTGKEFPSVASDFRPRPASCVRPAPRCTCGLRLWSARTRPRFGPTRHVASRKAMSCHRTPRSSRSKAPEGWRTPRRFAQTGPLRISARFWTAAALCRFFNASLLRQFKHHKTPIVHPKLKAGKEFPSVFAAFRRDKSAGIRFHVISARQVRFLSLPSLVRAPCEIMPCAKASHCLRRISQGKPRAPLPLRNSECGFFFTRRRL